MYDIKIHLYFVMQNYFINTFVNSKKVKVGTDR